MFDAKRTQQVTALQWDLSSSTFSGCAAESLPNSLKSAREASGLNEIQSFLNPINFVPESRLSVEFQKTHISGDDIEPDAPLQLSQVYRAEMKWAGIGFLDVVRAVHQASVPNAVFNAEHMRGFVSQHLTAPAEHQFVHITGVFLAIECRVTAGEAIYAHALA
jgi:hypothetical protein